MALAIIFLLRLLVPIVILRRPLLGGVLAMVVDSLDHGLFTHFGWGILGGPGMAYQVFDKTFDIYYLSLEVYMVQLWRAPLYRMTAYALFVWRAAGVIVFIFVQSEVVLVMFPNVFETFYLTILITGLHQQRKAEPDLYLMIMAFSLIQKMLHEYVLHVSPINWLLVFS